MGELVGQLQTRRLVGEVFDDARQIARGVIQWTVLVAESDLEDGDGVDDDG